MDHRRPAIRRSNFGQLAITVFGFCIYLAGIYTNAGPTVNDTVAPGLYALIGAAIMAVANPFAFTWRGTLLLASLLVFLGFSTVFGGDPIWLEVRTMSLLQMAAALVGAHIVITILTTYPSGVIQIPMIIGAVFVLVGALMEIFFPWLRALSDSFRETVFANRFIYDSLERDLSIYGALRPNLFTQEPSHLSKALVMLVVSAFLVSRSQGRVVWLILATIAGALVVRSPFVVLIPILALALQFLANHQSVGRLWIMALVGVPAAGILVAAGTYFFFGGRLEAIGTGEDFSFFQRFVGPYLVAMEIVEANPLFGVGLGAKEALYESIMGVFREFVPYRYLHTIYLTSMGNAAALSLCYFGAGGAIVFYWLLVRWLCSFGMGYLGPLVVVAPLLQLDGSLEGIRMWGYVGVILSAYAKCRQYAGRPSSERGETDRNDSQLGHNSQRPTISPGKRPRRLIHSGIREVKV